MKIPSIENVDTNKKWAVFLWTDNRWNEIGVAESKETALLLFEGGYQALSSYDTVEYDEINLCLGYNMPILEYKPKPPSAEIILGLAARYPSGNLWLPSLSLIPAQHNFQ